MNPIICVIAGSNTSGFAGLQADLMTMQHFGLHVGSVVTAITTQDHNALHHVHYLSSDTVMMQLSALHQSALAAIKIGMIGSLSIVENLYNFLEHYNGYIVLDPVFETSTGQSLVSGNLNHYVCGLKKLLPFVSLLTPNRLEAEILVGRKINCYEEVVLAANEILSLGVGSVLIKGGHYEHDKFCQDYWSNGKESFWLTNARSNGFNYRGTGCVLSSSIAACLALGYEIKDALVIAKMYINRAIRLAKPLYNKMTLLQHGDWPNEEIDLPYLNHYPMYHLPQTFPECRPLGLYPIVDSVNALRQLISMGVKTIQLRIKKQTEDFVAKQIIEAIQLARYYDVKLFINDYWRMAIRYGAYGVHLGQEDLKQADIAGIRQAGLRLGVSTHCYYEVARAHALQPSYIAFGPIFPTASKQMVFSAQGIDNLTRWRMFLKNYALVAIGGVDLNNFTKVLETGVDGIALISAIKNANDPERTVKKMLKMVAQYDA